MTRPYNFGAGPAVLPEAILQTAQDELFDWHGHGMSILEISHRNKDFMAMMEKAESDLRELMSIPNNYKVLFLLSSARQQFAQVPLNILGDKTRADYIDTGIWSAMALGEAERYCQPNCAASSQAGNYTSIPARDTWELADDSAYCYFTSNETINGVEFHEPPDVGNLPLVADMTSNILSKPIDVSRYGLIFAGAQKNIAPAGMTIVIIRDDLLDRAHPMTPSTLNYKMIAEKDSLLYTNSTMPVYMAGLMFEWVKSQGGLEVMAKQNAQKAQSLYAAIDASDFYINPVDAACRSVMNVPFLLADEAKLPDFLAKADEAGLKALKGHRYVGGLRASLYNAMPQAGVDALIAFMADFEKHHG